MAEDGDDMADLADLAYLVDADERLSRPQLEPAHEQEDSEEEDTRTVDIRESMPESLVIPRDLSFYGPPPPVPRKDTRPNTRVLTAEEIRAMQQVQLAELAQQQQPRATEQENVQPKNEPANGQIARLDGQAEIEESGTAAQKESTTEPKTPSSVTSWDIKIAIPAAVVPAKQPTDLKVMPTKVPPTNHMQTLHPLSMSPPSPGPTPMAAAAATTAARSETPTRPIRPVSLRLSSSVAQDTILNKVFVVERPFTADSRPYTADSRLTQAQTVYTSTTMKTSGSRIKYGKGRNATTELVPQPSDDPNDPLNWQTWRKELNLYALLTTVAMCNVMKTALVSVNFVLAQQFGRSYVAITALTGVPLMLSAVTGLLSSTAHKLWGRRPVYLISTVSIFIGLVWASQAGSSYGQLIGARIFQGLGWGAFDTLVAGSISDTFFEHQRYGKQAVYQIVNVATLWGPALIGGLVSQNAAGFTLQFRILAFFQALSIPLLIFGAPETMFERSPNPYDQPTTAGWTPGTGLSSLLLTSASRRFRRLPTRAPGSGMLLNRIAQYIDSVTPPHSYSGGKGGTRDIPLLLQAPRALIAPTTVLAFLASFLPYTLLWGYSASLSGLFAPDPFDLYPATVGSLLATPFILATAAAAVFALWPEWSRTHNAFRPRSSHLFVLGAGAMLSLIGAIAFSQYVATQMDRTSSSGSGIRFSALSFIFGLLAAGAYILDAPSEPLIRRSAQFTAPNLPRSLRNAADMAAGLAIWKALFAGIFSMGIPAAVVSGSTGIKSTGIGIGVVQIFVAAGVGVVWYMRDESVRRMDGRVMRCVDLESLRRMTTLTSIFEMEE